MKRKSSDGQVKVLKKQRPTKEFNDVLGALDDLASAQKMVAANAFNKLLVATPIDFVRQIGLYVETRMQNPKFEGVAELKTHIECYQHIAHEFQQWSLLCEQALLVVPENQEMLRRYISLWRREGRRELESLECSADSGFDDLESVTSYLWVVMADLKSCLGYKPVYEYKSIDTGSIEAREQRLQALSESEDDDDADE